MRLLGSRVLAAAVTALAVAVPAQADSVGRLARVTRRPASVAECPDAAIRDLHFGGEVAVDQVRVELRGGDDDAEAAAIVQVSSGRFFRRLVVARMGARGLRFEPALRGDTFRVALDPEWSAPPSACVERIVLLHEGREVAVITP